MPRLKPNKVTMDFKILLVSDIFLTDTETFDTLVQFSVSVLVGVNTP